jgi:LPXTG-motif cell wall-anchored protein
MNVRIRPLSSITLTAALALAPALSLLGPAAAQAQTAGTASVRIVKDAQPNGPRNFHFTTDIQHNNEDGLDTFTLDDDPTSARPNFQQFDGVIPGTYWVTEQQEDGWDLNALDCSGGQVAKDLANRKVTITVGDGDSVVCTFVNVRNAQGETTEPPVTTPTPQPSPSPTTATEQLQESTPTVSGEVLTAAPSGATAPVALPATLPFTGSNVGLLAAFGAAMVAAGAFLLHRSRRKPVTEQP